MDTGEDSAGELTTVKLEKKNSQFRTNKKSEQLFPIIISQ
jgi:hypothetical protein